MLSRPATKISLTLDDIAAYEQRRSVRETQAKESIDSSQETQKTNSDHDVINNAASATRATAGKSTMTRDQRIGIGSSRHYNWKCATFRAMANIKERFVRDTEHRQFTTFTYFTTNIQSLKSSGRIASLLKDATRNINCWSWLYNDVV